MEFVVLEKNGLRKEVKVGFSWTVFFFGLFVPLFRGDLKWAAIMFFGTILLGFATLGIGGAVLGIVMSFVYNKIYIKEIYSINNMKLKKEKIKGILIKVKKYKYIHKKIMKVGYRIK